MPVHNFCCNHTRCRTADANDELGVTASEIHPGKQAKPSRTIAATAHAAGSQRPSTAVNGVVSRRAVVSTAPAPVTTPSTTTGSACCGASSTSPMAPSCGLTGQHEYFVTIQRQPVGQFGQQAGGVPSIGNGEHCADSAASRGAPQRGRGKLGDIHSRRLRSAGMT